MEAARRRWVAVGGAALVVAAVAATGLSLSSTAPPGPPAGSEEPSASGGDAVGPVIFFETIEPDAVRLYAQVLDGRSAPREVGARFEADGPVWTVDPTGTTAVVVTHDESTGTDGLLAIDARSSARRWAIQAPAALDLASAVWSPDGTRLAAWSQDAEAPQPQIGLVDVAAGTVRMVDPPEEVALQGFAPDGSLVLRRQTVDPSSLVPSWSFFRVDPVLVPITPLTTLPDVRPAGVDAEGAAPASGFAIDAASPGNQPGIGLRLTDLRHATQRILASYPAIDTFRIDPDASGVAVLSGDAVRFVTLEGGASVVLSSPDPIAAIDWSTGGDDLIVTLDELPGGLTIVERATGRTVTVPRPANAGSIRFVAMPGGVPLPPEPLPAEPSPEPSPTPAGDDVAGFAGVLSASVVTGADDSVQIHAQRLVPTTGGGVRVAAEMPPIDAGVADPLSGSTPGVLLLPRPGSADVLVWIQRDDGASGYLWSADGTVKPVPLPADWPANTGDVAWRPDGRALAATASRGQADGGFEPDFVIAELGATRTTVIPVVGDYDRLEGWWSPTELRVGHGICTEGCPGRYAESARLRVADHRLVQVVPADRATAAIDDVFVDGDQLVLTAINDDRTDDLRIDWPATLGPTAALTPVGSPSDARDLVVERTVGGSTELYRVRDVARRAVAGRLADPDPVRIAALPGRDLQLELSPDGSWAITTDRIGTNRLVRLADGRAWLLPADAQFAWAGR